MVVSVFIYTATLKESTASPWLPSAETEYSTGVDWKGTRIVFVELGPSRFTSALALLFIEKVFSTPAFEL